MHSYNVAERMQLEDDRSTRSSSRKGTLLLLFTTHVVVLMGYSVILEYAGTLPTLKGNSMTAKQMFLLSLPVFITTVLTFPLAGFTLRYMGSKVLLLSGLILLSVSSAALAIFKVHVASSTSLLVVFLIILAMGFALSVTSTLYGAITESSSMGKMLALFYTGAVMVIVALMFIGAKIDKKYTETHCYVILGFFIGTFALLCCCFKPSGFEERKERDNLIINDMSRLLGIVIGFTCIVIVLFIDNICQMKIVSNLPSYNSYYVAYLLSYLGYIVSIWFFGDLIDRGAHPGYCLILPLFAGIIGVGLCRTVDKSRSPAFFAIALTLLYILHSVGMLCLLYMMTGWRYCSFKVRAVLVGWYMCACSLGTSFNQKFVYSHIQTFQYTEYMMIAALILCLLVIILRLRSGSCGI